jgi:N-acyl-D-amino-acid deacylase
MVMRSKLCLPTRAFRDSVRAELGSTSNFRLFNGEWDEVQVVETTSPANTSYEQRTVADIAQAERRDPLDVMLDLALAEDLETVFMAQLLNSDEEAVGRMLNHPHRIVSLSDAGAHLTFFNDAGFGLHLMGHWVRELRAMSMSEAVRRLTSHPAQVFGIRDRGMIRSGYAADFLLFDPVTVARGPKRRVFDLPGGAPRLTTDAVGVHGVWVNGQRIADGSGLLNSAPLAGELITSFAP